MPHEDEDRQRFIGWVFSGLERVKQDGTGGGDKMAKGMG